MGNAGSGLTNAFGNCVDALGNQGLQLGIGLAYVMLFTLNVLSMVFLVGAQTWPIAFSILSSYVAAFGHFTIMFLGVALMSDLIIYADRKLFSQQRVA